MEGQEAVFVLFGIKWTITLIITAIGGTIGATLTLYKLIERWLTRKARRLDMLREYLDKEEKDISSRRKNVLDNIRMSEHSFLSDKKFDVGAEIDRAIDLLDRGYPQLAGGKLAELEKKLETNEAMLRRRADDLKKHKASVHIFLAAVADRNKNGTLGLEYIDKALDLDQSDLDALKYKGLLLLHKGDLDGAERGFDKLRQRSNGRENASYRADAHLGLGTVKFERGNEYFDGALQSLLTALTNLNSVPASEQDHYTCAQVYLLQGKIYAAPAGGGWQGTDPAKALENYRRAANSLNQVPKKRKVVESDIVDVQSKIERLERPQ